jgi:hypothetical protein
VLISIPSDNMPQYFELLSINPEGAADMLLEHFAATACMYAKIARRWVVVHDREMPEWAEREKHLSIFTPDVYMKTFDIQGLKSRAKKTEKNGGSS